MHVDIHKPHSPCNLNVAANRRSLANSAWGKCSTGNSCSYNVLHWLELYSAYLGASFNLLAVPLNGLTSIATCYGVKLVRSISQLIESI